MENVTRTQLKAAFTRQTKVGKVQKVGKLVRSHVKLASNLNTAISNMADVVQWHLRRVAVCVLVLLYVNRRRIKRKALEK